MFFQGWAAHSWKRCPNLRHWPRYCSSRRNRPAATPGTWQRCEDRPMLSQKSVSCISEDLNLLSAKSRSRSPRKMQPSLYLCSKFSMSKRWRVAPQGHRYFCALWHMSWYLPYRSSESVTKAGCPSFFFPWRYPSLLQKLRTCSLSCVLYGPMRDLAVSATVVSKQAVRCEDFQARWTDTNLNEATVFTYLGSLIRTWWVLILRRVGTGWCGHWIEVHHLSLCNARQELIVNADDGDDVFCKSELLVDKFLIRLMKEQAD